MKISRPFLNLACLCILLPALLLIRDAGSQELPVDTEDSASSLGFSATQSAEIADFINQMAARHGLGKQELETTFTKVRRSKRAIKLVLPAPPGKPKNWQAYRDRFVEPIRIRAGVAFWDNFEQDLDKAEKEFGVPAEIIVGIIGVESIYGRHVGSFRVLDVLTTLAFDYPDLPKRDARMAFFRSELEQALLFARESKVDPLSLRGSYAGAIGWPQFMPGSIRRFGIDYDGDNKIDLRKSPQDAIGSVANYLVQHGWRRGDPTVFPVSVAAVNPERLEMLINQGLEAKLDLRDLVSDGVQTRFSVPRDLKYGLIDLQNGEDPTEYWLATNNFFAITKYNRSYFYAMSVVELGKAVRTARNPAATASQ
jgi:membrane-bound lytic murein transglycosylase B